MNHIFIKAFSLFLLLSPISIIAQTAKPVTIKGVLKNFSNQVDVEDLSEMQYLLPPNPASIVAPDANGNFKITFKLASPNYFRIGRNIVYLSPGDNLTVSLDEKDYRNGDFKGKGSQANMYLRNTPFPKAGSYLEAGRNIKPTAKETFDFIMETARLRKKELDQLKGVTPEFKRLETARIKADTIKSISMVDIYAYKIADANARKIYVDEFNKLSKETLDKLQKDFVDGSLMKLVVYRDIVKNLLAHSAKQADIKKIKDWQSASILVNQMLKLSDKNELKKFDSQISAIGTIQYRNALTTRLEELLKLGRGDVAIDFTAVDIKGNPVSLASLKGKVIYLDLWATWCGPCVYEKPFFEKLKEKYKDNNNVALVSLSIDDEIDLWKKDVDARKAGGYQWLINRNSLLDYNIIGVPRSIIIDKDFKIADLNGPHPSSKETEKVIEALLK
jgi:thiol-disulfide isomerase/thioredoxin